MWYLLRHSTARERPKLDARFMSASLQTAIECMVLQSASSTNCSCNQLCLHSFTSRLNGQPSCQVARNCGCTLPQLPFRRPDSKIHRTPAGTPAVPGAEKYINLQSSLYIIRKNKDSLSCFCPNIQSWLSHRRSMVIIIIVYCFLCLQGLVSSAGNTLLQKPTCIEIHSALYYRPCR